MSTTGFDFQVGIAISIKSTGQNEEIGEKDGGKGAPFGSAACRSVVTGQNVGRYRTSCDGWLCDRWRVKICQFRNHNTIIVGRVIRRNTHSDYGSLVEGISTRCFFTSEWVGSKT
jgi:hypothetical protein